MGLSQVAEMFRVSRDTVRVAIKSGALPATVHGEGKRAVYSIMMADARRWAISFHEKEIVEHRRIVRKSAATLREFRGF